MISFMITNESLYNQDMTRILKQWRDNFAGKHLRDRYCMDIMWCLWGQHSWFCKASLRICNVSLFECKGPWMLKTVINCRVEQRITKLDWKSTMYSVVKLSSYFSVQYFLGFNSLYLHNQHRILASSIYNIAAIRKILVCNFHF